MIYRSIKVYGQVQGVGFRYFAATTASRLGVVGWVRNCGDGSVEIEAAARETVMSEFIGLLERGPMFGHVERIVVNELGDIKEWRGFSIR